MPPVDPSVARAQAILEAGFRQALESTFRRQAPRVPQGHLPVRIASPYTGNSIELGQIKQTPRGLFLPRIKIVGGGAHRTVKGSTASAMPSDAAVDLLDQWLDREVLRKRMSDERRWGVREQLAVDLRNAFSPWDAFVASWGARG
jgi:hypothetical protein